MQPKRKSKATLLRRQPQRTCIVCRATSDKRQLVRIVRLADGRGVQIDERGKVPGRGAYLCHQLSCWQTAIDTHALNRALNTTLSGDEQQALFEFASKHMTRSLTVRENSQ